MTLKKQFLIGGCLYVGMTIVGYLGGWAAPVIPKLQDPEQSPLPDALTDEQASWVASFQVLGSIAGTYISASLCNMIGRKPVLFGSGAFIILGCFIMALSRTIVLILLGRSISGIGMGMIFVVNLIYIGEISSTHIRGTLLTLTGFFANVGNLFMYSVGPFVSFAMTCWIAVIMGALFMVVIYLVVPETPVYQIMRDQKHEAMANLQSLGREKDYDEVLASASEKTPPKMVQLTEIFTVKSNKKAFFIITTLLILQQFSGIFAVLSFVTTIFDLTGLALPSHISTIIIGVTTMVAGSSAPFVVDRCGRKALLLASTAICCLSQLALGVYFYLFNNDHPAAESLQWMPLASLMIYFVGYYMGLGIIPNTFIGEMFSSNVRSFASSLSISIAWLFGFGVTFAFGYMLSALGAEVIFFIFSGCCAFAFFFTVVLVPETKGKSISQIQEILSR